MICIYSARESASQMHIAIFLFFSHDKIRAIQYCHLLCSTLIFHPNSLNGIFYFTNKKTLDNFDEDVVYRDTSSRRKVRSESINLKTFTRL